MRSFLSFWACRVIMMLGILLSISSSSIAQRNKDGQVAIMLVGFPHLNQLYKKDVPQSDVLNVKRQQELAKIREHLRRFRPEAIMVEAEPKEQGQIDSLYAQYKSGRLRLDSLPAGRSERYQIGFVMAKELGLPAPLAVDYYAATSQSLLSTGKNIAVFELALKQLQNTSRPLGQMFEHDSLSVYDLIALANHPAMVAMSHRALFNAPAMVMHGTFSPTGKNTQDLGKVDTTYIGAHFITLFYNRNLKIYSNILTAQQQRQPQRVLVLLGQNHIGVQEELFAANPNYRVVHASTYLKTKLLKLKKAGAKPAAQGLPSSLGQ